MAIPTVDEPTGASAADARLARERAFHDERYRDDQRSAQRRFYGSDTDGRRRFAEALAGFGADDRVLELGCGPSSAGWDLAERGVSVLGIDVSPVAVAEAIDLADRRSVAGISFAEMNAEALEVPDRSFDGVIGTGILHHLDLDIAFAEIRRVLRPCGRAVFFEPLGHNPAINLYRRLTPDARTVDEHPLRRGDLDIAERHFIGVHASTHEMTAIAARPFGSGGIGRRLDGALASLDRGLVRVPGLRWWAWIVVLELSEPLP